MESTSARMNRLGKSLVTDAEILSLDRVIAEIDAVEADAVCALAAELLAPERLSAAGIGPSEEQLPRAALERVTPSLAARRVKILLNGHKPPSPEMGKVGAIARAGARRGAGTSSSRARPRPRRWSTSPRPAAVVANVRRALAAGLPCVVGTSGWDPRRGRRGGAGGRARRSSTRRTSRSAPS